MLKPELTLYDYMRIIRKRKWIIILTAFSVIAFTIIFTGFQRSIYRADAKILLPRAKAYAELVIDEYFLRPSTLYAEAEFLRSVPVMTHVARALKKIGPNTPPERVDEIVTNLRNLITTSVDQSTNGLIVSAEHDNPDFVTALVNQAIESYSIVSVESRQKESVAAREFIESQLALFDKKLDDVQARIEKFRNENMTTDLGIELKANLDIANLLARDLALAVAERFAIEERLAKLDQKDKRLLESNQVSELLRKQLIEKQTQLLTLKRKYTPNHPALKDLESEIAQIKEQIEDSLKGSLGEARAKLQATIEGSLAKERALERAIKAYNSELRTMPRKRAILSKLEQEEALLKSLQSGFRKRLEDLAIIEEEKKTNSPIILKKAMKPEVPIKPNKKMNIIIGTLTGILLGLFFAFFIESIDVTISTVDDVEAYVNLPVMGIIPHVSLEKKEGQVTSPQDAASRISEKCVAYHEQKSIVSESFRILRTNLHFLGDQNNQVILVSSSLAREGKTFISINLAITFAQLGSKVLLADFNLRDPEIHAHFGFKKNPGITDVLIGDMDWHKIVRVPLINNLHILCAGPIPPNPSELISSARAAELLESLRKEYDIIICDSSPLIPVTDGAILAKRVNKVLIVHNVLASSLMVLLRTKALLHTVGVNISGIVLNNLRSTLFMEHEIPITYYYKSKRGEEA